MMSIILIAEFCCNELLKKQLCAQRSSTYDDLMKKYSHNILYISIHAKLN